MPLSPSDSKWHLPALLAQNGIIAVFALLKVILSFPATPSVGGARKEVIVAQKAVVFQKGTFCKTRRGNLDWDVAGSELGCVSPGGHCLRYFPS